MTDPHPLWLGALLVAAACGGCTSPGVKEPAKAATPAPSERKDVSAPYTPKSEEKSVGERELESGIKSYEDGAYKTALRHLHGALALGLDAGADRARAYKYLAFIDCGAGREKSCREEFRKALDADPGFDLAPAEAGHPIWGPVFRRVKAEAAGKLKAK